MAKVMAAYKGGAQNDPNNYHPLSMLYTLSKIIERHISIQLTSYLESYQLFSPSQSGFRSGHSCQTCLTKMTNIWLQTLNNKRIIGLVTLDLTKAFNVFNHKILLDKLKIYKCSDHALKLLKSYIENRYQFVQLGGKQSSATILNDGVPQGSILGSILFKGHMKRYFVIRSNIVILHIKYVLEYLTTDSS